MLSHAHHLVNFIAVREDQGKGRSFTGSGIDFDSDEEGIGDSLGQVKPHAGGGGMVMVDSRCEPFIENPGQI